MILKVKYFTYDLYFFLPPSGDGRGDACEGDWDKDGVPDAKDICPSNSDVSKTDFSDFTPISLNPNSYRKPQWKIYGNVRKPKKMCFALNSGM